MIVRGKSKVTGTPFNISVAFAPGEQGGPAIAESTFHHFADYNWDPSSGSPSFVSEPPGDGLMRVPEALADTHRYVLNIAAWLSEAKQVRSEARATDQEHAHIVGADRG